MNQTAPSSAPRAVDWPQPDRHPRYAMVYGDGQQILSDSPAALIAVLIPDYPQPDGDATTEQTEAATLARVNFVTQVAAVMQHAVLQGAADAGAFDPTECGDETLTELMKDRRKPFLGIDGPNGQTDTEWRFNLPLFLVATDYHPYTDRALPTGNVVLLDGSTELGFLTAVSRAGLVDVNVLAPASHQDR